MGNNKTMLKLISTDLTIDAAAVEGTPSRTVSGVAVPYGVVATVSSGEKVIFEEGSDRKSTRLNSSH